MLLVLFLVQVKSLNHIFLITSQISVKDFRYNKKKIM